MNEMFLLGAGASVEAQVPDSYKMTRVMLEKFSSDQHLSNHSHILRFVVGGLIFQKGGKGENPFDGINIEELFTTIQLLAEREKSELSPFISAWHPLLDNLELGEVTIDDTKRLVELLFEPLMAMSQNSFSNDIFTKSNFRGNLQDALFFYHNAYSLQKQLGEVVKQIISARGGEIFRETNELMIKKLIELIWIDDPKQINHLIPLIDFAHRNKTTIATLNYDNALELAGQQVKVPVDTGFESWSKTGEFGFAPNCVSLIKLHGSIDWALSDGEISKDKPIPYQVIQMVDKNSKAARDFTPAIVFGGKNKLTAKGPFLSLLRAFEKALLSTDCLTIIGYSFRDEHINEYIGNWLNRSPKNIIRIIDPYYSNIKSYLLEHILTQSKNRLEPIVEEASKGIQKVCQDKN